MKKILYSLSACLMLLSCGQTGEQKDKALVNDFYEHVLSIKPMTDEYLKSTLSEDILNSIWGADYEDSYSYWVFRTGMQDGPSSVSAVESIEALGDGWYRVSYSDLGNPGVTDVQVANGKIVAYKPFEKEDGYAAAIRDYMVSIGAHYAPAEYCIPYSLIVDADESNPDDIRVWGDFWVENYDQAGDTLKLVSGGSHPGCMHVKKTDEGFEVTQFDAVGDGSDFTPTAKAIFGDRYDAFIALSSNDDSKNAAREKSILDYAKAHGLSISCYQDFGWPAVTIQ
ncbi:MAG: hypothetical protein J6O51_03495 [Bacteroidales bacterium]|nr:hypothetical protein [Bacteroidales bacterium]